MGLNGSVTVINRPNRYGGKKDR